MTMRISPFITMLGLVLVSPLKAATPMTGTVSIDLPPQTAQFKSGTGVDLVQKDCLICHSSEYVSTQPPLTAEQWRGEVVKMKHVMGAPIEDSNIDAIVNYLVTQYGKK